MNLRGRITSSLITVLIATSTVTLAGENMEQLILGERRVPDNGPLIVPSYLADQDFSEAAHTFSDVQRIQEVYSASEFSTGPILITGFYWRPTANLQYGFAFHAVVPDFQLNLSTTSKQPDQLSSVFAENIGSDESMVYKGRLAISSRFEDSVGNTKKFDIFVRLKHPFLYNPAKGNLLLDIRESQPSGAAYVSEYGSSQDGGSRMVALGDPNAATATFQDTGIDVIEVIYTRVGRTPLPFLERAQFSN